MATLLAQPANLVALTMPAIPPELNQPLAPSDHPLLLLPVRLETRFFAQTDGTYELRVRIYPDQIHIDSHEPALSREERQWGQHFWEQTWRAGNDETTERAAWQQLADRFDAQRAAWIARVLAPTNPQQKPTAPVPADKPLTPAPSFPAATIREDESSDWQRAPLARLMPQRWVAIATTRGTIVAHALGTPISRDPAVGPDPKDETETAPDQPAFDAGMRWMIDFEEAERLGMALRLKMPAALAQQGVDALVVFGVSALDENAAAAAVASVLDAHHYTEGLGFLRSGTPTNNSAELASGWSAHDPLHQRSFLAERRNAGVAAGNNAEALARALGLDSARAALTLGSLWDAAAREPLDARQMAAALWPATWGYYLDNLIGYDGTGLTPDDAAWARAHFIANVRAFGPLPTLRVGRQPYGVLPVSLLGNWTPAGSDATANAREQWLAQTLAKLRDQLWMPHIADVPRVGRSDDPAQDLAAVMRSDGLGGRYRLRHLLGPRYLHHLRSFLGEDLAAVGWIAAQSQLTNAVLQHLGFPWRPRLTGAAYSDAELPVNAPLVQAGDLSAAARLEPNYISALLADPALPVNETDAVPPMPAPATLLHLLLRQSLQLEYRAAAARLVSKQAGAAPLVSLVRDEELNNLNAGTTVTTWRTLLGRASPATGNAAPSAFLKGLTAFDGADLSSLGETRASLAHLQGLPPEHLERLLVGTLDTASHRLDAWITSLATRRLNAMREQRPAGLRVGGFGWVLNLKALPGQNPVATPAGESGTVFAMSDDSGFIHAPSVVQAETAALLRNAHLTHTRGDAPDLFAVDLSSRRVRLASALLDGVRQGQPLGALLGYRFERRLHELKLDDAIDDFRLMAPLTPANAPPETAPAESIAARNVVDGLKLYEMYRPLRENRGRVMLSPLFTRCVDALELLADAVDAVSDAVTAETAYQAVRGNVVRTGATLQAIASGETPPPELEVARTPRSGIALTHRIVVLWNAVAATAAKSPRAAAEPHLNAWAAQLLGSPHNVRLNVERVDASGARVQAIELRLDELDLEPIDVVYLAPMRPGEPMPQLEQRLLRSARRRFDASVPQAELRLALQRAADWLPNELSIAELGELASRARQLFAGARALDARDLTALGGSTDSAADSADFEVRANAAQQALGESLAALRTLLDAGDTSNTAAWSDRVATLGGFGIAAAYDAIESGDALIAQARAVAAEAQRRVELTKRADNALERMRAIFGGDFLALPRFTLGQAVDLQQSLAATTDLQGGDPLAVYGWLQQVQRVREPVARLTASLNAAEAVGADGRPQLKVAQLPHTAGERWVGLPIDSSRSMPAGRLSLVVQAAASITLTQPLVGLMIDEWVEVVPSATETTAITFQHNAPDSRAPQSMLLAVPPVVGQPWTAAMLHRLLLETLALAQIRAVDAEGLDMAALNPVFGSQAVAEVAHFLPALYLPVNADGDAPSPDLKHLTG